MELFPLKVYDVSFPALLNIEYITCVHHILFFILILNVNICIQHEFENGLSQTNFEFEMFKMSRKIRKHKKTDVFYEFVMTDYSG